MRLALAHVGRFAMRMIALRPPPLALLLVLVAIILTGCESSGPAQRNIEVVYRFQNLRKQAAGAPAAEKGSDEWSRVRPILDHASVKPIQVDRSHVRTLGMLEVADYDAICVLPSLAEFQKVQADLEALGASDSGGERIETYLSQVTVVYKSNFVAATANIVVSGASVMGNRVRIYGAPGSAPIETTVGSNGIWTARLDVVPQTQWVYGSSEDPSGRSPPKYFRVNIGTKQQERVEPAEFQKLFPPAKPAPSSAKSADHPKAEPPSAARDDQQSRDQRLREDEEFKRRRIEENRKLQDQRNPNGGNNP